SGLIARPCLRITDSARYTRLAEREQPLARWLPMLWRLLAPRCMGQNRAKRPSDFCWWHEAAGGESGKGQPRAGVTTASSRAPISAATWVLTLAKASQRSRQA